MPKQENFGEFDYLCSIIIQTEQDMNYYEVKFNYESAIEPSVVSDILAAELGEIGFESFTETDEGLQAYIQDKL